MRALNQASDAGGTIEARTIQKLKVRILPLIWVLYIIAFVDRINIGFAALTMNRELAISSEQFGLLTGIFFIGYFLSVVRRILIGCEVAAFLRLTRQS